MKTERWLYWAPRVLAILVILFTSLFALDVFTEDARLVDALIGLVIHLIPQILIAIALIIAWKRPRVGGIVFLALGACSLLFFSGPLISAAHLILTLPVIVIGILFWIQAHFASEKAGEIEA
jgi:hypothetical protein